MRERVNIQKMEIGMLKSTERQVDIRIRDTKTHCGNQGGFYKNKGSNLKALSDKSDI